ncbi:short-chain dehydrogenase [Coleophoma cylindrospora]|uniref:Short-chain dehydrogenase n=1 Tax=Coleophoma cylindrospora TaxID=1849047 RepID=A0A3D8SD48_9HELO|nr:short-chain dehydrogenase [Coleophoma cylindrospora]
MSHLLSNLLFDVADRNVAITGASSGLGRMLAKGFTANGANTILIDIDEKGLAVTKAELEDITRSLGKSPTNIITICGDLGSEIGVQSVINQVKTTISSLDVLIQCAAVRYMNKIPYTHGQDLQSLENATGSLSYSELESAFRVNVFAPYFLTAGLLTLLGKAAAKGDGRGCVILFSSPASVHNHQFVPAYQLTKASIDHMVRIMAMEFSDFYIRVNAISPGIFPSAMTDPTDPESNFHLAKATPAGRAGDEGDIVGTALWLASKAGSFMDGKVVRVEGGRLLVLKGVTTNSD